MIVLTTVAAFISAPVPEAVTTAALGMPSGASAIPQKKVILDVKKKELPSRIQDLNTSIDYIDEKEQLYDDVLSDRRKYCNYLIPLEE